MLKFNSMRIITVGILASTFNLGIAASQDMINAKNALVQAISSCNQPAGTYPKCNGKSMTREECSKFYISQAQVALGMFDASKRTGNNANLINDLGTPYNALNRPGNCDTKPIILASLNKTLNALSSIVPSSCYWMQNSGNYSYVLMPGKTKEQCKNLDSCHGGGGQSGGGCYKWSSSPTGANEPW